MKMFKIAVIPLCFTVLLFSACPDPVKSPNTGGNKFWAFNWQTSKYYQVTASEVFEGEHCVIWAELSANISPKQAEEFAREYDDNIHRKVVDTFGRKNFTVKDYEFNDIMEFAGELVGADEKLTILLLNIQDGYTSGKNAFVAGYFSPSDFYGEYAQDITGDMVFTYSNQKSMIYVDTWPGLNNRGEVYKTLAHELQHLINFVTSVLEKNITGKDSLTDTWIDEGLSSQAEFLYLGDHPQNRLEDFNEDRAGTLAKGNNFFVWDNHKETNAILDEYSTVYLFFQWLYMQSNKNTQIFYDIENSEYSDYRAITKLAAEQGIISNANDWETLLGTWLAANYLKNPDGKYGYKGELSEIQISPVRTNGNQLKLSPGEGVYSRIINTNFSPPFGSGTHVKYAGLQENSLPVLNAPFSGDMLLTFNANSQNQASAETGYLTGAPFPRAQSTARLSLNERTAASSRPRAIDARDIGGNRGAEFPWPWAWTLWPETAK